MAIELSDDVVNRIHESLEGSNPLYFVKVGELKPYCSGLDYSLNIAGTPIRPIMEVDLFAALFILAAEDELSDYPMEATS